MKWLSLTLTSLFCALMLSSPMAWAAACCGGGFALPSIIVGDDQAQLTTSLGYSQVVVDNIDAQGLWRKSDEHQNIQTYRLEGARIFADRWQSGFVLPVMQRSYMDQKYAGLGDVSASLGYEYLPDWEYHPIRPKGIGFLQVVLPTGKAKAESENGGLDSRGNGFLAVGLGTLLTKNFSVWDVFLSAEVHHSFEKNVSTSFLQGSLKPGNGATWGGGLGYNTAFWRFGGSILWSYEDPIAVIGSASSSGSLERYATAVLSASYMVNDEWAGTLAYSDQTLFGSPINTSLSQGVSLQLQKRWSR